MLKPYNDFTDDYTDVKTYFGIAEVKMIYLNLTGTERGMNAFISKAKQIATKQRGYYIFKNESALFNLFKEEFPEQMEQKGITTFNHLVARVM